MLTVVVLTVQMGIVARCKPPRSLIQISTSSSIVTIVNVFGTKQISVMWSKRIPSTASITISSKTISTGFGPYDKSTVFGIFSVLLYIFEAGAYNISREKIICSCLRSMRRSLRIEPVRWCSLSFPSQNSPSRSPKPVL